MRRWSAACLSSCPPIAGGAGLRGFRCPAGCVPSLSPCLLSAFLLCLFGTACKYGFIWRFRGIFSAFYGVCVGLYCLGALRGLCGFCTREWLGGFMSCGVFRLSFSSFLLLSSLLLLSSCSCPASLLGFLPCLLSCSLS